MSLHLVWERLDKELSQELATLLEKKLNTLEGKPDFIGEIKVSNFSFGTALPEITITDITEPFDEFYLQPFKDKDSPRKLARKPSRTISAKDESDDLQLYIQIIYRGNMSITLTTELIVNKPFHNFISLPISLTLTQMDFIGNGMVALVDKEVSFCLDSEKGEFILDLMFRSDIGDPSKKVLRNADAVEKFVGEQIRKFVNDHLVFPNYYSFSR